MTPLIVSYGNVVEWDGCIGLILALSSNICHEVVYSARDHSNSWILWAVLLYIKFQRAVWDCARRCACPIASSETKVSGFPGSASSLHQIIWSFYSTNSEELFEIVFTQQSAFPSASFETNTRGFFGIKIIYVSKSICRYSWYAISKVANFGKLGMGSLKIK